jgi:hypothetical protein
MEMSKKVRKMDEKQNNNTEPIEITKARSRVTTIPAFQTNTPGFMLARYYVF